MTLLEEISALDHDEQLAFVQAVEQGGKSAEEINREIADRFRERHRSILAKYNLRSVGPHSERPVNSDH